MPDASVSANVDRELLDSFDQTFETGDYGSGSRSKAIEHAMKLAVAVDESWDAVGLDFETERAEIHSTRTAILNWDEYDRRRYGDG